MTVFQLLGFCSFLSYNVLNRMGFVNTGQLEIVKTIFLDLNPKEGLSDYGVRPEIQ
jgi:hypothetical protein